MLNYSKESRKLSLLYLFLFPFTAPLRERQSQREESKDDLKCCVPVVKIKNI
jgi:hypothetical protein